MSRTTSYTPVVSIIGFHHARGPEVEHWIGVDSDNNISEWPLLPFLALADGAHFAEEDFSYFTLKHEADSGPTTLFGISCTRQLDSNELIERPADVTRSTVQKAVVVIASNPTFFFGHLKQQLSAVTTAWFAQRDFEDLDIIRRFQESLKALRDDEYGRDQYIGLSLRELVYEFRHQTLVLFKCALLQPKMLFFGSRCERLCMTQFSLLSLVPGLLRNLEDCSDPDLNNYESKLKKPTSVKTSDRRSLLKFMGLPLQIFGKGSLFGPYTPLQQLDILADFGTKSYIVGSTNSLLLQQRDRYSDILVNLDENTIEITSSSLRAASVLSAADRRWIDALVLLVTESWDEADPSRPKTMGFVGSEDYIRLQFEEYVLSMVSAVKYHLFLEKHHGSDLNLFLPDIEGDPAYDFQMDWVDNWKMTENFRIFQKFTDSELFDLVPPKHVMAGGLTMEDVQRRIVQQMKELGVDEKVNRGREVLATTLASGRNNVSTVFSNLSKNVEKFREQRRSQDLANLQAQNQAQVQSEAQGTEAVTSPAAEKAPAAVPVTAVVTPVLAEASTRAGAYFSSWASWAGEKRKKVFTQTPTASPPPESTTEKSLPSLPADDPPPKKSFEESIFDARMRAAHGRSSSSSSVFSPRTNSMTSSTHPTPEVKNLDDEKGVGLGIVNLEPQSPPPVPAAEAVVETLKSEEVEPTLQTLPIKEELEISPPTPVKDEPAQLPLLKKEALPPFEIGPSQQSMPTVEKVEKAPDSESEIVSPAYPSLSFVRRKMTLPRVETVEPAQPPMPIQEVAVESSKPELERVVSPTLSLSFTRRKMSMPKAEKAELAQSPVSMEENVIVSPEPEPERVASPPLSLPFMRRKMTISKAEKAEPAQPSVTMEERAAVSPEPEPERVASPPLSLPFMRRKMTIPKAEKDVPIQLTVPVEEGFLGFREPEQERVASPPPSLPFMRRRMTIPKAEKVELAQPPVSVDENTIESPESEQERVASPPPLLPSMRRKMTIPKAGGVELTQPSGSMMERPVESLGPVSGRDVSPPLSVPVVEKIGKSSRPGRLVQSRSFGPAIGGGEIPTISDRAERNRRSIPTFDRAAVKPLRSERTPEPVKIPEYTKAAPLEVKPARERAMEPMRVPRHSRAESAVMSTGEPAPKPLRRAETQSATMIGSKTSGESLKAARHTRSESNSSITNTEKLASRSVKSSIAERAKRFSQTQEEPSDSGNVSPARAAFAARRAMFEKK